LLKEEGETNSFISLISLDLSRCSVQKLHTVEYPTIDIEILVNNADPTTFLLTHYINNERFSRMCKIVEKKIVISDITEVKFYPDCFYDKYAYGLDWYRDEEDGEYIQVKILSVSS
jgi:hypothetical protein